MDSFFLHVQVVFAKSRMRVILWQFDLTSNLRKERIGKEKLSNLLNGKNWQSLSILE